MVSFLELIPGPPKDPLFVIRIVKRSIIWHPIFIAVELELLLIRRLLQVNVRIVVSVVMFVYVCSV